MERKAVLKAFLQFTGGSPFITKAGVARCMKKKDAWARDLVEGLDKIPGVVKGDKYFVEDVVDRLLDLRRV